MTKEKQLELKAINYATVKASNSTEFNALKDAYLQGANDNVELMRSNHQDKASIIDEEEYMTAFAQGHNQGYIDGSSILKDELKAATGAYIDLLKQHAKVLLKQAGLNDYDIDIDDGY
jgi:hypothetical protein